MVDPSICLIKTAQLGSCMIISHYNSPNSYIIWFDYINGHPLHNGIPGYDVFPSEAEAKDFISSISKIERENRAQYLVGINNIKNHYLIITAVTKAKELAKIMDKHPVYSIVSFTNWGVALDNDSYFDEQTAEQEKQFFSFFPVSDLHFFCPTFDLTSIFGTPTNPTMIWNLSLSKPFKKFKIPCCIDLIQGSFGYTKLNEQIRLYSILRRCSTSSIPVTQEQEINEDRNLGNEFEIEYIIESMNNGLYETRSHILRRCDLPHLFTQKNLSPEEATVIYSSFFDRLIELYEITKITFLDVSDLNSNKSYLDPKGDNFLKKVITLISGAFNVDLNQFDWNSHSQRNLYKATNYLMNSLGNIITKYGYNFVVWKNGHPSIIHKQKGFFVVSDKSGFDQSTFGSFFIGLCFCAQIMNQLHIIQSIPNNIEGYKDMPCCSFFFQFFMFSNRKLGQLSTISTSFNERDFSILAGSKDTGFMERQNYQLNNNTREIIKAFLKDSKSSTIFSEEDCVSIVPAAHIVYPSTLNLKIFSLFRNELSFINPREPIILSLSRPCYITKIIMRLPRVSNSSYSFVKPGSVTISGGMYLNRMVPLFEDILIVSNESIKSVTISNRQEYSDKYHIKTNLNTIEKVRFIQFCFNSTFPRVTISNIYVYGNCEMKKKTDMRRLMSENLDIDNSKQVQIPTFSEEVSPESITSWEKKRLYSFLSFNDFAKKMIERELNPFQMTVSSLIELKNYKALSPGKVACSICNKKKSVYQCGMCGEFFCSMCKPQVETKEMQSETKSITVQICPDCSEIRNKILKLKPLLELLKARMVVKLYPFIGKYDSLLDGKGYQNSGSLIGTIFISEPPIGVKKGSNETVLSEVILDPSNEEVWSPRESVVPLLIYLKQESIIESITIRCNSPIKVILDDQELEFIPPYTTHSLAYGQSILILKMTLIGAPIEVRNISVFGSAVRFGFPIYTNTPNSFPSRMKEMQTKQTPVREKSMIHFRMEQQESIKGLLFDEVVGDQTIFFEFKGDANKKTIVPLNFPKGRFSSCSIEFPRAYKTKEFNLWFSSSKNQAKNMKISPLCVSRSNSISGNIYHLNI